MEKIIQQMENIQDWLENVLSRAHSQPNQQSKLVALYLCSHGKFSQNSTHSEPISIDTNTKTQFIIIWVESQKVVNDIKVVGIQQWYI